MQGDDFECCQDVAILFFVLDEERFVRTEAGANVMPFLAQLLAQASDSAIAALGAARFTAEFDAGQRLDRDTALALALGKPAQDAVAASGDAGAGLLGKREADVARLVAGGLTNKQIGAELQISDRTVQNHLANIYAKLGVASRTEAVTAGLQRQLIKLNE